MIGFITLNQDTFSNPTIYSMISNLNSKGIPVTIYCGYQNQPIPNDLKLTQYIEAPKSLNLPKRPRNLFRYLAVFLKTVLHIKRNNVKHLIAIDPTGLILASRCTRLFRSVKIHYCSFEIFFFNEIKNFPQYLDTKRKEIYYTKYVESIIIQDHRRKSLLVAENLISPSFSNWHMIPVAPLESDLKKGNNYDLADLGIPKGATTYIHSGSVAEWAGINEIIESIKKGLPKNNFIIVHNKSKFDNNDSKHLELRLLSEQHENLILHDKTFKTYNDYINFLSIFDYGIVIYKEGGGIYTGLNIKEIGLSSGKFSSYMYAGLPSVLYNCTVYKQLIDKHNIGVIATTEMDLSYHIQHQSLANRKKEDCVQFYEKVLNPQRQINHFIDSLING